MENKVVSLSYKNKSDASKAGKKKYGDNFHLSEADGRFKVVEGPDPNQSADAVEEAAPPTESVSPEVAEAIKTAVAVAEAAPKPAPKPPKTPASKKVTIRSVAEGAIRAGKTPDEALSAVMEAFPASKCNIHWCRWLANSIRGTPGKKFGESKEKPAVPSSSAASE